MTTTSTCCDSCASGTQDAALAIACTLGAGGLRERVASIRDLARRGLKQSRREPLRLHLVYASEVHAEVEDLVRKESECCGFLGFKLLHDAEAVRLTITAPIEALAATDELFAHFAPELAVEAA